VHGPLDGRHVVVTGAATPIGSGLASALAAARATVSELPDDALVDRAAAESAFATAVTRVGPVDALVHAAMPAIAFEQMDLAECDDARWDAVWEGTMRATLFVLQAAYGQLHERGGRIVLITPTVSMSGAARLVPYTTAVEGQRLLAKSAARQWGPDGITVNCLAPAPEHVPIGLDSMTVSLAPPALGGPGDVSADLGPVAVWLVSDAAHFVTGVTVCADGGVWMAP
jgi:3-oxoacyl-[acyl-carrier protein] reductase